MTIPAHRMAGDNSLGLPMARRHAVSLGSLSRVTRRRKLSACGFEATSTLSQVTLRG